MSRHYFSSDCGVVAEGQTEQLPLHNFSLLENFLLLEKLSSKNTKFGGKNFENIYEQN